MTGFQAPDSGKKKFNRRPVLSKFQAERGWRQHDSSHSDRILIRVEFNFRRIGHIDPDMHVRLATEIPDE